MHLTIQVSRIHVGHVLFKLAHVVLISKSGIAEGVISIVNRRSFVAILFIFKTLAEKYVLHTFKR
jgi:hypothetical protein